MKQIKGLKKYYDADVLTWQPEKNKNKNIPLY